MSKRVGKQFLIGIMVVVVVLGSGFLGFNFKKNVVASIGGEVITQKDLEERIKSYPAQYAGAFQKKENKVRILNQMIDEKAVALAAKKQKIHKTEEYKKQLDQVQRQLLVTLFVRDYIEKKIIVTDAEVVQFYDKNPRQFQAAEQRRARHILVKTEFDAKEILRRLKQGEAFEVLAKEKSIDPSSANGGDLGWFSRGQLVPEFEQPVFSMRVGTVSSVIKTPFGYHVVRLDDMRMRQKLEFSMVKAQIKEALLSEKKRTLMMTQLSKLKKDFKVKINLEKL